jgi:hypothetical protein
MKFSWGFTDKFVNIIKFDLLLLFYNIYCEKALSAWGPSPGGKTERLEHFFDAFDPRVVVLQHLSGGFGY